MLATEAIMIANKGYKKVSEAGKLLAERINTHLKEMRVVVSLYINVMLDGGILEINFSEQLANGFEMCKSFSNALMHNKWIIPDGHCFYICTEHIKVIDQIEEAFVKAFNEVYMESKRLRDSKRL